MFANDGFKIRGWDETGLHGRSIKIVKYLLVELETSPVKVFNLFRTCFALLMHYFSV